MTSKNISHTNHHQINPKTSVNDNNIAYRVWYGNTHKTREAIKPEKKDVMGAMGISLNDWKKIGALR